jgi:hypothetical protein
MRHADAPMRRCADAPMRRCADAPMHYANWITGIAGNSRFPRPPDKPTFMSECLHKKWAKKNRPKAARGAERFSAVRFPRLPFPRTIFPHHAYWRTRNSRTRSQTPGFLPIGQSNGIFLLWQDTVPAPLCTGNPLAGKTNLRAHCYHACKNFAFYYLFS